MSYAVFSFLQSLQRTSGSLKTSMLNTKKASWIWITTTKTLRKSSHLETAWLCLQAAHSGMRPEAGSKFSGGSLFHSCHLKSRQPTQNKCSLLKITHKHGQDSWAYSGASRIWSDTCQACQASLPAQGPRTQAAGNMFLRLSWFCAPTCSILSPPASVTTAFNAKGLGKSWGLQWSAWHPASTNFSELWK